MKKSAIALAAAMGCGLFAMNASAMTYSFTAITGNGGNIAAAEAQLSVTISDYGMGQVLFTFNHAGPGSFFIADVYFDDGTLLALSDLIDADQNGGDAGVDFSALATPPNLPAGNTVGFETTAGFSADSDSPVAANGVGAGESLGVIFTLQGGKTFADVIAAMAKGFAEGGLVIGIHVQGFDGGFSESFITGNPPPLVPLPTGVALGLAGLVPVIGRRRR